MRAVKVKPLTYMACAAMLTLTLLAPNVRAQEAVADEKALWSAAPRLGRTTGLPLPRFVSLRYNEVNMRRGPGRNFPIAWVFHRRGLPLEVIDEYLEWRRIRDMDGSVGWVHVSQLVKTRRVLTMEPDCKLRAAPHPKAQIIARAEKHAVLRLEGCEDAWCRLSAGNVEGWALAADLWGADAQARAAARALQSMDESPEDSETPADSSP